MKYTVTQTIKTMSTQKSVVIKLFFNLSDRTFYIQIGEESLFRIRDTIAARIQEKESIEIRHVRDIQEMQQIDKS